MEKKIHAHPFQEISFSWIDASNVAEVIAILVLPFQKSHGQVGGRREGGLFDHIPARLFAVFGCKL